MIKKQGTFSFTIKISKDKPNYQLVCRLGIRQLLCLQFKRYGIRLYWSQVNTDIILHITLLPEDIKASIQS